VQVPQVIELVPLALAVVAARVWDVAADATAGAATPSPAAITAAVNSALIFRMKDPP
jgi:hypothetical protein